jgi:hypothetical protein
LPTRHQGAKGFFFFFAVLRVLSGYFHNSQATFYVPHHRLHIPLDNHILFLYHWFMDAKKIPGGQKTKLVI